MPPTDTPSIDTHKYNQDEVGVLFSLLGLFHLTLNQDAPVEVPYHLYGSVPLRWDVKMNRIKTLIRDFEKTKDPFQKLIVLGSIQNELETIKKELSRKIK